MPQNEAGMCPICRKWIRMWWGKIERHKSVNGDLQPIICLGSGETPIALDL